MKTFDYKGEGKITKDQLFSIFRIKLGFNEKVLPDEIINDFYEQNKIESKYLNYDKFLSSIKKKDR